MDAQEEARLRHCHSLLNAALSEQRHKTRVARATCRRRMAGRSVQEHLRIFSKADQRIALLMYMLTNYNTTLPGRWLLSKKRDPYDVEDSELNDMKEAVETWFLTWDFDEMERSLHPACNLERRRLKKAQRLVSEYTVIEDMHACRHNANHCDEETVRCRLRNQHAESVAESPPPRWQLAGTSRGTRKRGLQKFKYRHYLRVQSASVQACVDSTALRDKVFGANRCDFFLGLGVFFFFSTRVFL